MQKLKKLLSLLLSLCLVLSFFPAASADGVIKPTNPAPAEEQGIIAPVTEGTIDPATLPREPAADEIQASSGTCGENLTWTLDDDGVLTISGTGDMYDYAYLDALWKNTYEVKSAVIEPGVTGIGVRAFINCLGLESVSIPESVTRIGDYAFGNCSALRGICLPSGLSSLGSRPFEGCSSLTAIEIAEENPSFQTRDGVLFNGDATELLAFPGAYSGSYAVPETVTTISSHAFYNCKNVTAISIPASVTSIGMWAFLQCSALTEITVAEENPKYCSEDGVLYTKDFSVLVRCPTAKTGVLSVHPGTVTLDFQSCNYCTQLTEVLLPDSVTEIVREAFFGCTSITEITLPTGLASLKERGFADCTALAEIHFQGVAPDIAEDSFRSVNATVYYPKGDESWTEDVFQNYGGSLTWVQGPVVFHIIAQPQSQMVKEGTQVSFSVTASGENLSYRWYCRNGADGAWTPVENSGAEANCSFLAESAWNGYQFYCQITDGEKTLSSDIATLLVTDEDVLAGGLCGDTASWMLKPDGTLVISGTGEIWEDKVPWSDWTAQILRAVVEPGITALGGYSMQGGAFKDCVNLTEVELPEGLLRLGGRCFQDCDSLREITLPASLTNVEQGALGDCDNLERILVADGSETFISVDGVLFSKNMETLYVYPAGMGGSYTVPDSVKTLGWRAFWGCRKLSAVQFPDTLSDLGANPFQNCVSLKQVNIPLLCTELPISCFYGCSALEEITVPANIWHIATFAFRECTSLQTVHFLGHSPRTDDEVFTGLTLTAYYPKGDETWNIHAFQTMGGNVTWLEDDGETEPASSGTCGDKLTWTLDNSGVLTISGTGEMWYFDSNNRPWENLSFSSVVVEEGVTGIGTYAFAYQSDLTAVSLPNSLQNIASCAFESCRNLKSINIPDQLRGLGDSVFFNCTLTELHLPASVYSMGRDALNFSSQNVEIYYGGTVAQWRQAGGSAAIQHYFTTVYCSDGRIDKASSNQCGDDLTWSLNNGTLSVSGTGDMWKQPYWLASSSTVGFSTVILEEGVTSIGEEAFWACNSLTEIRLPDTLRRIDKWAFLECTALERITLPASLEELDVRALAGCALTGIYFRGSAPIIGSMCFSGLTATAYYPEGDPSWTEEVRQNYSGTITWVSYDPDAPAVLASGNCGDDLTWTVNDRGTLRISGTGSMWNMEPEMTYWQNFCDSISSVVVDEGVTDIGEYAFNYCMNLRTVSLPDTLEAIGNFTFLDCVRLEEILLPKGVTTVACAAFMGCRNLREIRVAEDNPAFCSVDGVLFDKNVTALLRWPCGASEEADVPATVTVIGEQAFAECKMKSITIPAGVTSICMDAFHGCSDLREIRFEGSAPDIAPSVFSGVTATAFYPAGDASWTEEVRQSYGGNITWHEGDYAILGSGQCGENAFWSLSENGVLTISGTGAMWDYGNGPDTMADWMRDHYNEIKRIVIEEGITYVGEAAFAGGYYFITIDELTLPESLVSIGKSAFYYVGVEEIDLPGGLREIGDWAFAMGPLQGELRVPGSVERIGESAFRATSFTKVTLEDGVKEIGVEAFANCLVLESVTIPASVNSVGEKAFAIICERLTDIYYNGTSAQWKLMTGPNTVEHYITTVHCTDGNILPASTERCGDDLTWSLDANGVLTVTGTGDMWDMNRSHQPWYSSGSQIKSVVLGDGVTSVGDDAFNGGFNAGFPITELSLPDSLREIGDSAFSYCKSLTSVSLPAGVESIGMSAFSGCEQLTALTLGDSLQRIGDGAFSGCGIVSVSLPESLESLGSGAFANCKGLTEVTFRGSAPTIGDYAFSSVTATVYYPEDDASWTEEVRQNYGGTLTWEAKYMGPAIVDSGACGDDLTWRLDENGLVTVSGTGPMWDYASRQNRAVPSPWSGNNQVQALLLKPGVTSVGSWAFAFCQLREVEIPETVTAIGASAFSDCSAMETLRIPGSVKTIGNNAFAGCSSLSSLNLPEGVESIGSFAFDGCCGLTELRLPATLTEIGASAFSSCFGIREISFAGPAPTIGENAFTDVIDATVYYPAEDPSWTETLQESLGEGLTWAVKNPGDVNGDGVIDILDLVRLLKYFAGTAEKISRTNADLTGDGTVSAADLMRLRQVLVGLKPEAA